MKCQSMTSEILGVLIQVEFGIHIPHGSVVRVNVLPSPWIFQIEVLCKDKEVLETSFLKHTHEICKRIEK